MNSFLRKLENMGIKDIVLWFVIIFVATVASVGFSVPVILEQPQWWGYQADSTGYELVAHPEVLAEPYCVSNQIVDWDGTYYVADLGMHLSDEEVKEWYSPFFILKLGYIPSDIRIISADPSTDSRRTHYIEAESGQIILDGVVCFK